MIPAISDRAATAAALLAIDPAGLGGVVLRAAAGPRRDAWVAAFRALAPKDTPWRRLPPGISAARLIGGLDLAATLAEGRPVAERGLLAAANGGVIVAPMAERMAASVAGPLGAALDTGAVVVERDGLASRLDAGFALVLLDEGIADERAPAALAERLAFALDLDGPDEPGTLGDEDAAPDAIATAAARARLGGVTIADDMIAALCEASLALGVGSARASIFAARAARAAAALAGRDTVAAEDVVLAARLVLGPRATTLPRDQEPEESEAETDAPDPDDPETDDEREPPRDDNSAEQDAGTQGLADRAIEAAKAAIPADLLAALAAATGPAKRQAGAGRGGSPKSALRGRPAGARRGTPGHGARIALVETLRAAAPWQAVRRANAPLDGRLSIRREDFRVARLKQKSETATIFVVDASGSAALNRLGEVKGAVELVLAECYIRRDSVALIAFRGPGATLILPPTRSLARAKRTLAGQPGGGGTPLAAAIDMATALADSLRRRGPVPLVVFLTDGRANIGRGGRPGRSEAEADALAAARTLRASGVAALLIDSSPRPNPAARHLAIAMGARYQPLPHADARLMSQAVLAAAPDARAAVS